MSAIDDVFFGYSMFILQNPKANETLFSARAELAALRTRTAGAERYAVILASAWKYARENGVINSQEFDYYGGDVEGVDFVSNEILHADAKRREDEAANATAQKGETK